jgi:hypothetical protein
MPSAESLKGKLHHLSGDGRVCDAYAGFGPNQPRYENVPISTLIVPDALCGALLVTASVIDRYAPISKLYRECGHRPEAFDHAVQMNFRLEMDMSPSSSPGHVLEAQRLGSVEQ